MMFLSFNKTYPSLGLSRVETVLINVDLPDPDSPITIKNSP